MKKQCIINTRIVDPRNNIDEIGGVLINEEGKNSGGRFKSN